MTIEEFENCKKSFYDTTIADVLRAIDGGSKLGALTLSLISIDAIAMALSPKKMIGRGSSFDDFIEKYLSKVKIDYLTKIDEIRYIRNLLCHTYGHTKDTLNYKGKGKLHFSFSHELNRLKHLNLSKAESGVDDYHFHICVLNLVADLVTGCYIFFNEMESSLEKNGKVLDEWMEYRISIHNADYKGRDYKSLHRFLGILDSKHSNLESFRMRLEGDLQKSLFA
jgi:hypothetical protein